MSKQVNVITALVMGMFLLTGWGFPSEVAQAEQPSSRLNQLLIRKTSLYLPTRMVLGEATQFTIKGQPGMDVQLFLSPESSGYFLDNTLPLRVGPDPEMLSGTIPENGVLHLGIPVPNEPALAGKVLYVDAVAEDSNGVWRPLELIEATGRRTAQNTLVITPPVADSKRPGLLPMMPGVSPQAFDQLTTMAEIYTNSDDPRRNLLDDGLLNKDTTLDRNVFIQRGGFQQGLPGGGAMPGR